MNEWKECPKCKCLNKGRERCQDCGRDLKDVAGDKPTPPITAETKHVGISDLLDGLAWTKTKPTKCGYYWVKGKAPHHNPRIMRFKILAKMGGGECIQPVDGPLSTSGWEWFCGPIPKPSNVEASHAGLKASD